MAQATNSNTEQPAPGTRPHYNGYLLTEDAEYLLADLANAMRGIAHLTEGDLRGREMPEMPAQWMAAIFRALADSADSIRTSAAQCITATIKGA